MATLVTLPVEIWLQGCDRFVTVFNCVNGTCKSSEKRADLWLFKLAAPSS